MADPNISALMKVNVSPQETKRIFERVLEEKTKQDRFKKEKQMM